MLKHLIPVFAFLIILFACKEKTPKTEPVETPVQPEMVDTFATDTIVDSMPIPEPPKPENKYFLIAASFKDQSNADNFKSKLIAQGYESEVIIRQTGVNQDFYKVSFKGFSDKAAAFKELRNEMSNGTFQDVWLLVK